MQADKHTQETTKLTKKNNRKTQMEKRDHVQKKKTKTSEADSFRNMNIKISCTPEDGRICRNM
jgi:hypothetical protein